MQNSRVIEKGKQHKPIKAASESLDESSNGAQDEIEILIRRIKEMMGVLGKSTFPPIDCRVVR